MNANRLMEDLSSSLSPDNLPLLPNRCDASLALVCNLLTNVLNGDLAEHNLVAFLDTKFLRLLLENEIETDWLGHRIPLLLYGLLNLRTAGSPARSIAAEDSMPFALALRDIRTACLQLGTWDDVLLREIGTSSACPTLLSLLRPDTSGITAPRRRYEWLIRHGFQELPLYRSKLRRYFTTALGSETKVMSSGDAAFIYHEVSSSCVPLDDDLFKDSCEFRRWISVHNAMLIFKRETSSRIFDRRWIKPTTTIVLHPSCRDNDDMVSVLLGALGGPANFVITIESNDPNQVRSFNFDNTSSVQCDVKIPKWVNAARITVAANRNYVATI